MRISQAKTVIMAMTKAKLPAFLWGPPGVGKSDSMRQSARYLGLPMIDIRAVLLDPVDLRGVPRVVVTKYDDQGNTVQAGITVWNPPSFLPREGEGIIFWDELPQATGLVQSSVMQLMLDRRCGDYVLPDGWAQHAAGNRVQDRSGANKLLTALANRFACHINVEVSYDDWREWAIEAGVDQSIRSYLAFRPGMLDGFKPESGELAFPSPRSWSFADRHLKSDLPAELLLDTLSGCVGPGAAAEYIAHRQMYHKMPDIDGIIANPTKADIPPEPSVLWAVATALADKCKGADTATLASIVKYGVRLPCEMATMLFLDGKKANKALFAVPEIMPWAKENSFLFTG